MFTGIITHLGTVSDLQRQGSQATLIIQTDMHDLQLGESIAVDGACLTVSAIRADGFQCDISAETWARCITRFYQLQQPVNLERAVRAQDRLGGHVVSGHIDGVLRVFTMQADQDCVRVWLQCTDKEQQRYLCPKGCVTLNGVSLTVNEVEADRFNVMLVPHTLSHTNLANLKTHDWVNVEYDQMIKMVARQVQYLMRREEAWR